ncbi:hypothetical protein MMC28_001046 [Mycoblastus sanguinarius]|nr:hypothetical protein [Mycoblastus sanguinarius]
MGLLAVVETVREANAEKRRVAYAKIPESSPTALKAKADAKTEQTPGKFLVKATEELAAIGRGLVEKRAGTQSALSNAGVVGWFRT